MESVGEEVTMVRPTMVSAAAAAAGRAKGRRKKRMKNKEDGEEEEMWSDLRVCVSAEQEEKKKRV